MVKLLSNVVTVCRWGSAHVIRRAYTLLDSQQNTNGCRYQTPIVLRPARHLIFIGFFSSEDNEGKNKVVVFTLERLCKNHNSVGQHDRNISHSITITRKLLGDRQPTPSRRGYRKIRPIFCCLPMPFTTEIRVNVFIWRGSYFSNGVDDVAHRNRMTRGLLPVVCSCNGR